MWAWSEGVIVRQIPRVETGCMSYLIGDPGSGVAAVVDPTEDPRVFLQEASALGLQIERVIETHTHQDHVSGAKALAARLRAPIHLPFKSPAKYRTNRSRRTPAFESATPTSGR